MATTDSRDKSRKATERVAQSLYATRQRVGRSGDAASDWQLAEKIVRSPLRTTLFVLNRPLLHLMSPARRAAKFVGWDIPRWIFVSLPQVEMVKLVALPLILAGATSIITRQLQWEANQSATLDGYFDHLDRLTFEQGLLDDEPDNGAIVLARGRTIAALRKLDLERKQQLLAFLQASDLVQISEEGNDPVISFAGANLSGMDLREVALMGTEMRHADLRGANLSGAWLRGASLANAVLPGANLSGAELKGANLEMAWLVDVNLAGTELLDANLAGARLERANLTGAMLGRANLAGAEFLESNLEGANITQEQLSQSLLCRTRFSDKITLDSDRDCERFE